MNWLKKFFAIFLPPPPPAIPPAVPANHEKPAETKPHAVNPAYEKAKTFLGMGEQVAWFVKYLSTFWSKAGLKDYKTIVGPSFAWCMLFVLAMMSETGQKYVASAGARNSAKIGVSIDWKKDGIPEGAIMHLNHAANCSSGSNNHVTFAGGDCAPQDLIEMTKGADGVWRANSNPPKLKAGVEVPGLGGNQGNRVSRSMYSVKEVCEVRWPFEVEKPGRILISHNCSGKSTAGESTR